MNTFEIVRLIGDAPKELLSFNETSLLTRMAFIGNREGKNINPGVDELVRQTKSSKRTVIEILGGLVKKKVLIVSSQRNRGEQECSCYELNIKLLQERMVRKEDYYKILEDNIRSKMLKKVNQHSARSAPTQCARSAPTKMENDKSEVRDPHLPSARSAPTYVRDPHLSPYRPPLIPPSPPILVELALDDCVLSAPKKSKKIAKVKKSWSSESLEIFEHWKKILNHPDAKFDKARKIKIEQALAGHGYTVEELKKAIEGNKKSAWHQGVNPGGVLYHSISLIFRNPEKIETFLELFDTQGAVKNKNATTGLTLGFVERQKSQVNMLKKMGDKYFPHLSDNPKVANKLKNLLTERQEKQENEQK